MRSKRHSLLFAAKAIAIRIQPSSGCGLRLKSHLYADIGHPHDHCKHYTRETLINVILAKASIHNSLTSLVSRNAGRSVRRNDNFGNNQNCPKSMIRIFRTAKMQAMSASDGRAYWRYALAETLLIVVGILLPLQINNWNEERMERGEIKLIGQRLAFTWGA